MAFNAVIDPKAAAIVEAVCYWLGYQFKIGRGQLIHEASLRYPIADTITAKDTAIHQVALEQLHPLFKSKQIDLAIYKQEVTDPQLEKDDTNIRDVYEFKLAKEKTSKFESDEHQRVFDDVVRLAYYHQWHQKNCYFLMCGRYEDFNTYFVGQPVQVKNQRGKNIVVPGTVVRTIANDEWQSAGLYKDWFGFRIREEKEKEFKILDPKNTNEWGLRTFQAAYLLRDEHKGSFSFNDSIKIKTTCLAITPNGSGMNRTHAAGIWKIEAMGK